MKTISYGTILPVALLLFVAGACAPRTNLEPATGAEEVGGMEEAARSVVDGVRVVAQADEWPGPQPIKNEVTPLRVVVENNSDRPLRLRYSELALLGPQGTHYAALPPFEVEGSVQEPVLVDTYDPIYDPGFIYDGFAVAPIYDPIYDLGVYGDPFLYDYSYYDAYETYWVDLQLPTAEMLQRALPEGVLDTGGRLDGWVYFEKVPDDQPRVTFRADLVNAVTGQAFGEIRIPFTVE